MGGFFVLLGLAIGVTQRETFARVLLVIGGLGMLVCGLRRSRELNFDSLRVRGRQDKAQPRE